MGNHLRAPRGWERSRKGKPKGRGVTTPKGKNASRGEVVLNFKYITGVKTFRSV